MTTSDIKLRLSDQLIINYEFELHFHVVLPPGVNVTRLLCVEWGKKIEYLRKRRAEGNKPPQLDKLFEDHFSVKLPKGEHVTADQCERWYERHSNFLANIALARKRGDQRKDT